MDIPPTEGRGDFVGICLFNYGLLSNSVRYRTMSRNTQHLFYFYGDDVMKLPAHRAALPGKEVSFILCPLTPAYKAGLAGHVPATPGWRIVLCLFIIYEFNLVAKVFCGDPHVANGNTHANLARPVKHKCR